MEYLKGDFGTTTLIINESDIPKDNVFKGYRFINIFIHEHNLYKDEFKKLLETNITTISDFRIGTIFEYHNLND